MKPTARRTVRIATLLIAVELITLFLGWVWHTGFAETDYPVVYKGGTLNGYFRPGSDVALRIMGRYGIRVAIVKNHTVPGPASPGSRSKRSHLLPF
jgi:hypothetical protein